MLLVSYILMGMFLMLQVGFLCLLLLCLMTKDLLKILDFNLNQLYLLFFHIQYIVCYSHSIAVSNLGGQ